MNKIIPTEDQEQIIVADWLRAHRIFFHHANRKGQRKVQHIVKEARLGSLKGFPDLLIFDASPVYPKSKGTAIEMKRTKGGKASAEQVEVLGELYKRGWVTHICNGADAAIELLQGLGYGRKR